MKQNLQEVRRMQFLAGIVSEQADIYSGEEQEVGRLGEVRPRKELPMRDLTAELAQGLDQAGIDYEMSMEGEHGELIKMIHPETQGTIFAGQDSGGITIDGDLGDNDPDMIDVSVEEALEYLKGLYGGGLQEVTSGDRGYPFRVMPNGMRGDLLSDDDYGFYRFDADGENYAVSISNRNGYLWTHFHAGEDTERYVHIYKRVTNQGEPFKIFATVIGLVDSILKAGEEYASKNNTENPIKGICYTSLERPENITDPSALDRRDKIWRRYVKDRYPNARVTVDNHNNIWINFQGTNPKRDMPRMFSKGGTTGKI